MSIIKISMTATYYLDYIVQALLLNCHIGVKTLLPHRMLQISYLFRKTQVIGHQFVVQPSGQLNNLTLNYVTRI